MPSPENEPDRYATKWCYAPKPPRLISTQALEKGEKFTQRQQPVWSLGKRLEYDKKMAAARSPGPIYDYDLNYFKDRGASFQQYRGERSWFNKPRKGMGEGSAGRSSWFGAVRGGGFCGRFWCHARGWSLELPTGRGDRSVPWVELESGAALLGGTGQCRSWSWSLEQLCWGYVGE